MAGSQSWSSSNSIATFLKTNRSAFTKKGASPTLSKTAESKATDVRDVILDYVKTNGPTEFDQLLDQLSLTESQAMDAIDQLVKYGRISLDKDDAGALILRSD